MLERVKSKFAYVNKSEEVAIIKLSKTRLAFDPAVEDELENVTMEFDIAGLLSIRAKLRTYECMLDSSTSSSREFAIEDADNYDPPLEVKERCPRLVSGLENFFSRIDKNFNPTDLKKYAVSNQIWHRLARRDDYTLVCNNWRVVKITADVVEDKNK